MSFRTESISYKRRISFTLYERGPSLYTEAIYYVSDRASYNVRCWEAVRTSLTFCVCVKYNDDRLQCRRGCAAVLGIALCHGNTPVATAP